MPATADIIESAGTKVSLSATKSAAITEAGFTAVGIVYTEVGFVTDAGEHGPESSTTTLNLLSGVVRKRKGAINYGQMPLSLAFVPGDAGQIIGRAGVDDRNAYAVKVEYPDGTIEYYNAYVTSFKVNPGNSESSVMGSMGLEIDSASVWVDPV